MTDAEIVGHAADVVKFWFEELDRAAWWRIDENVDATIRARFEALHNQLSEHVEAAWLATPNAALAAVIVLDQFSRNLFRGEARAFAQDAAARAVAESAIAAGFDRALAQERRAFLYMPFMHSEDGADQARCVALFETLGGGQAEHARAHQAVIARFGRFPKRNAALKRASTPEEIAHMATSRGVI